MIVYSVTTVPWFDLFNKVMLIQDSDNDIIEYLNPTEKSLEIENLSQISLLITYRDTIQ